MRAAGFCRPLVLPLGLLLLCCGLLACSGGKGAGDYIKEGKVFLKAKQYDQAIASFTEALKLDPKSIQALNNRGIAYCIKGEQDRAISDFSHAIQLDPKFGKGYNNRAVAYMMKGDKDKARADVAKAQALGVPVNKILTETLAQGPAKPEGPGKIGPIPGPVSFPGKIETAPGPSPVPAKPEAQSKPEAQGKPGTPGKGEAQKK